MTGGGKRNDRSPTDSHCMRDGIGKEVREMLCNRTGRAEGSVCRDGPLDIFAQEEAVYFGRKQIYRVWILKELGKRMRAVGDACDDRHITAKAAITSRMVLATWVYVDENAREKNRSTQSSHALGKML